MQPCPEAPGRDLTKHDEGEEKAMYPGLNDTDSQVATFQHRQLVATGQHQQYLASLMTATSRRRLVSTAIRFRLGTFLVTAGKRFPGAHAIARESCVATASSEVGAMA